MAPTKEVEVSVVREPAVCYEIHSVKTCSYQAGEKIEIVAKHFWFKPITFSITNTVACIGKRILECSGIIEEFEDFHMADAVFYIDAEGKQYLEIYS